MHCLPPDVQGSCFLWGICFLCSWVWAGCCSSTGLLGSDFPRPIAPTPASGNNWHTSMGLRVWAHWPLMNPSFFPLPRWDSWGPKSWSNWLKVTSFLWREIKIYQHEMYSLFSYSLMWFLSTLKEECAKTTYSPSALSSLTLNGCSQCRCHALGWGMANYSSQATSMCLFLYNPQAKNGFLNFKWLPPQIERIIWHIRITGNSNFSGHQ